MKYFLLILITAVVFSVATAIPQDHEPAQLENILKLIDDTSKVNKLIALAWEIQKTDKKTAGIIADKILGISKDLGYKKGIGNAIYIQASIYAHRDDYSPAVKSYLSAIDVLKQTDDAVDLAWAYNDLGWVMKKKGNYSIAMDYYFKSLKVFERISDKQGISGNLINIGNIYNNQGNYENARVFYRKALKICLETKDTSTIASLYTNIGNVFLSLANYDSASYYYNKSITMSKAIGDSLQIITSIDNLGDLFLQKNMLDNSLIYYQQALNFYLYHNKLYETANTYTSISKILIKKGKSDAALEYLSDAREIAANIGANVLLKNIYQLFVQLYEKNSDFETALNYQKKYEEYKDSVFNHNKSIEIGAIVQRYEFEKSVEDQLKLEKLEEERINKRNYLQYSGITIFIMLVFVLLFLMKKSRFTAGFMESVLFISFILLFEFMTVCLDPFISGITDSVPIYCLLANVILAFCLMPIHEKIEYIIRERVKK